MTVAILIVMLVLFENLIPFCMLVIEAFQSSISSRMRFQKGLFLQRFLIAIDCALLEEPHLILKWRIWKSATCRVSRSSFCHLRLNCCYLSKESQKSILG